MNFTDLSILFNDGDIVVCIKPRGVLSEGEGDRCMPHILSESLGSPIFTVHRLDRETEGIMVYAKSSRAAASLSKQITGGIFKKEYLAVVSGAPQEASGTLTDLLFYDRRQGRSYVVTRERAGVKSAELDYEVLKRYDNTSLLRIILKTGRTHQIRVQFASRKMSLVGDRRYGAKGGEKELMLYAYKLSFVHPRTNATLEFSSRPSWAEDVK